MADLPGPLGEPQEKLEVLDAVEGGIEAAHRFDQAAPGGKQMADVHHPERVDGRPIGLQERVPALALGRQLVLVAVDHVRLGVAVELADHAQERFGGELVVVVEEGDELSLAEIESPVRRGRDPGVLLQEQRFDAAIGLGRPLDRLPNPAFCRAVVDDPQLPVRIGLGADRVDRLLQQAPLGLVGGHHHRDQGPLRERGQLDGGLLGARRTHRRASARFAARIGPVRRQLRVAS